MQRDKYANPALNAEELGRLGDHLEKFRSNLFTLSDLYPQDIRKEFHDILVAMELD